MLEIYLNRTLLKPLKTNGIPFIYLFLLSGAQKHSTNPTRVLQDEQQGLKLSLNIQGLKTKYHRGPLAPHRVRSERVRGRASHTLLGASAGERVGSTNRRGSSSSHRYTSLFPQINV